MCWKALRAFTTPLRLKNLKHSENVKDWVISRDYGEHSATVALRDYQTSS